jgi:uncharacterized membrane protein
MSLRVSAALLALLCVFGGVGPAAGSLLGQPTGHSAATLAAQQPDVDPDGVTFRTALSANADADWNVTFEYTLASDAERERFESFAGSVASSCDLDTLDAFRAAKAAVVEATGREMSITGVECDYAISNRTGRLSLSLTWTNFARTDGQFMYVDDAFNTSNGTWFQALDPNQRLIVVPPEGYSIDSAEPSGYSIENEAIIWESRDGQEFEPGALSARFTGGGADSTQTPDEPSGLLPGGLQSVLLVLVLVSVVGAAAYVIARRDGEGSTPATATGDDPDGGTPATDGTGTTAASATEPADGDDGAAVDEELLSDEERIERLLEANGGRMKQASIVTETNWSNAKVSQLLSSMDEADRIDKLRIGRENLISFPDQEITDSNDEV